MPSHEIKTIAYDEQGEFVADAFYQLRIPFFFSLLDGTDEIAPLGAVRSKPVVLGEYIYAEVISDRIAVYDCPIGGFHDTGSRVENVRADLYGGPVIPSILYDVNMLSLLVSERLAHDLAGSGLIGIAPSRMVVSENQSQCQDPVLFRVEFCGRSMLRKQRLINPTTNVCPSCHYGPIYCPACHDIQFECPACHQSAVVPFSDREDNDRRWVLMPLPKDGAVLDGEKWDGSDFIAQPDVGVVTRRAVKWLLERGAAPFVALPLRVDVSTVSRELRRQILDLTAIDL